MRGRASLARGNMLKCYEASAHAYAAGYERAGATYYAQAQYWDAQLTRLLSSPYREAAAAASSRQTLADARREQPENS